MRATLRILGLVVGVTTTLICGARAQAIVISLNYGHTGTNLLSNETAGVISEDNWNNATSTNIGTTANLAGAVVKDGNGNNTTVGTTWSGGGLTNNPRLTTGGGTGDQKMMNHFWNSGYRAVFLGLFINSPTIKTYMAMAPDNGPAQTTFTFTNMTANFPNGYDVYVYVAGAGTGSNEQNSGGVPGAGGRFQNANPVAVVVGPAGTNALAATMNQGIDNSNINTGNGAGSRKSFMVGRPGVSAANLPNAQVGVIYPTTQIVGGAFNGNWTASWNGTYVTSAAALTAADAFALDENPDQGGGVLAPGWEPTMDTYERIPTNNWTAKAFHDPTARGIPAGNYIKFSGLSFNNLDIFQRNFHGSRSTAGGSGTDVIMGGGITGIQIVGLDAEVVPEPATIAVALAGLIGLVGLGWCRMRRA